MGFATLAMFFNLFYLGETEEEIKCICNEGVGEAIYMSCRHQCLYQDHHYIIFGNLKYLADMGYT